MFASSTIAYGIVNDNDDFNPVNRGAPNRNVQAIHAAFLDVKKVNNAILIDALVITKEREMVDINYQYLHQYGADLNQTIYDYVPYGSFQKLARGISMPIARYEAEKVFFAINRKEPDQVGLLNALVGKTNREIRDIKRFYVDLYNRNMTLRVEQQLRNSGIFGEFILRILDGNRDENTRVDDSKLNGDVSDFGNALKQTGATSESEKNLIPILTQRSNMHLQAVFSKLSISLGVPFVILFKKKFGETLNGGLYQTVRTIIDPAAYNAQRLKGVLIEGQINADKLIRLVVRNRDRTVMDNIKIEYKLLIGNIALPIKVKERTPTGDFQKLLLTIIGF